MVKVPVESFALFTWLVESVSGKRPVDVARALVVPTDGKIPIRLLNSRNELIKLAKGRTIAVMESLPDELLPETICAVGDKSEVTDEKKK